MVAKVKNVLITENRHFLAPSSAPRAAPWLPWHGGVRLPEAACEFGAACELGGLDGWITRATENCLYLGLWLIITIKYDGCLCLWFIHNNMVY